MQHFANLTPPENTSHISVMEPIFSAGEDESQLTKDMKALLGANWKLDEERMGIEKTYYFKTWTKVLVGDSQYHFCFISRS